MRTKAQIASDYIQYLIKIGHDEAINMNVNEACALLTEQMYVIEKLCPNLKCKKTNPVNSNFCLSCNSKLEPEQFVSPVSAFWHFCEFVVHQDPKSKMRVWNSFIKELYMIIEFNKLSAILAPRAHGKSLEENSLILTSKGYLKIEEINIGDKVSCLNEETFQITENIVTSKTKRYKKKLYKLTTRTGRECKLSDDHPLFTIYGWRNIKSNLTIGDYVAIPRIVPKYNGTNNDLFLAKIAGLLVSEGSCTTKFKISLSDKIILLDILKEYNKRFNQSNKLLINSTRSSFLICVHNVSQYFPELINTDSYSKKIPSYIMKGTPKVHKTFLRYVFEGDGGVDSKNTVSYMSMSHTLVLEIQLLLQIYGINSYINKKKVNNGRKSKVGYRLFITGKNVLIFKEKIGFVSKKKSNCLSKICEYLNKSKLNTNIDIIPRFGIFTDRWIANANNFTRKSAKKYVDKYNNLAKNPKSCRGWTRNYFNQIYNTTDFNLLKKLYNANIFWDEIISIDDIGYKWCYDIQIGDGTKNYIANGFYTHNSYLAFVLYTIFKSWLWEYFECILACNIPRMAKRNLRILKMNIDENEFLLEKKDTEGVNRRSVEWGKDIISYNKGMIETLGVGSTPKSAHVHWILVDDPLRDDRKYPDSKIENFVLAELLPCITRMKGRMCVIGTPIHKCDIFHTVMNEKEDVNKGKIITDGRISYKRFYSKVFDSIIDERKKQVLLSQIMSYDELMAIKKTQGEVKFNREYRCRCIDDKDVLFPWVLLRDCTDDEIYWIDHAESPDDKFVIGIDVATAQTKTADWFAAIVIQIKELTEDDEKAGLGKKGERIKIIRHVIHEHWDDNDAEPKIKELAEDFNHAYVLCEQNNAGIHLIQYLERMGVNVEAFRTDRMERINGVRFMRQEMKNGHLWFPGSTRQGDQREHEHISTLKNELMNFGPRTKSTGTGTIEVFRALAGHDDLCDALWIANNAAKNLRSGRVFAAFAKIHN